MPKSMGVFITLDSFLVNSLFGQPRSKSMNDIVHALKLQLPGFFAGFYRVTAYLHFFPQFIAFSPLNSNDGASLKVFPLSGAFMDSEGRKCLLLISSAMNKYLHLFRRNSFGLSGAFVQIKLKNKPAFVLSKHLHSQRRLQPRGMHMDGM